MVATKPPQSQARSARDTDLKGVCPLFHPANCRLRHHAGSVESCKAGRLVSNQIRSSPLVSALLTPTESLRRTSQGPPCGAGFVACANVVHGTKSRVGAEDCMAQQCRLARIERAARPNLRAPTCLVGHPEVREENSDEWTRQDVESSPLSVHSASVVRDALTNRGDKRGSTSLGRL